MGGTMGEHVNAVMDKAIADEKIVGAELIVFHKGQQLIRRTAGWFDREAEVPMMENAIYRLASVTKPIIAATTLAMVDKGLIRLDDSVSDYLPYFTPRGPDGQIPRITIHHLLTHTSGLGYHYPAPRKFSMGLGPSAMGFKENFTLLAEHDLLFIPGTNWLYSVGIDVLGAVLSAVHGGTLQDAVATHVTGPLGMTETGFFVAGNSRLAIPYADGNPPTVMTDPQPLTNAAGETSVFSPSRIFSDKAFQSGGAGMAGTASEIAFFLETLRKGGEPILSRPMVQCGFANQIGDLVRPVPGTKFNYFGQLIVDPVAAESPAARNSISWGGVYGHSWLVDPSNELTIVSMSNTAFEGCTGAYPNDLIRAVYADFI